VRSFTVLHSMESSPGLVRWTRQLACVTSDSISYSPRFFATSATAPSFDFHFVCAKTMSFASCNKITHNTHPTHHPRAPAMSPLLFALVGLPALAMAAPEIVSDGTKVQLMAPQGDIEVRASPRPIAHCTPSFVSPRGGRG
jgi:hypothetical protein